MDEGERRNKRGRWLLPCARMYVYIVGELWGSFSSSSSWWWWCVRGRQTSFRCDFHVGKINGIEVRPIRPVVYDVAGNYYGDWYVRHVGRNNIFCGARERPRNIVVCLLTFLYKYILDGRRIWDVQAFRVVRWGSKHQEIANGRTDYTLSKSRLIKGNAPPPTNRDDRRGCGLM